MILVLKTLGLAVLLILAAFAILLALAGWISKQARAMEDEDHNDSDK